MSSHARTVRQFGTHPHQGATAPKPLPYRLNPRRTSRVLGWRVTPRTGEGWIAGMAGSILLIGCSDLPNQLISTLTGY